MTEPSEPLVAPPPLRVVFTPEGFGRALTNHSAQPALDHWREGRIQPVVSRLLLVRTFRLLHRLALPERLIRWWGWWLGSPKKTLILADPPPPVALDGLYEQLALAAQAAYIVGHPNHSAPVDPAAASTPGTPWITAAGLGNLTLE